MSGDINGDGKPELAAVKEQNGVVAVVMNASDVSYPVDVTADFDLGWVSEAGRYSEGETVTLTAEPGLRGQVRQVDRNLAGRLRVVDVSTDPIYEFTMGTTHEQPVGNFVPVCEVKVCHLARRRIGKRLGHL